MPGRSFDSGSYRYGGAGGQEMDNEISGVGNSYTAEYLQYDSRLMRRWNLDPIPQIFISDYAAFGNNPIRNVDPNGAYFFGLFGSTSEQRSAAKEFSDKVGGTVINKHSKDIVVSYTKKLGFKGTILNVLNRHQYFVKDGSVLSDEGVIDLFQLNAIQSTKAEYLDSASSNWLKAGLKFVGRGMYGGLDGAKVAITSFALPQELLDLDGPLGLDGNIVPPSELTDRGLEGYSSGVSFMGSYAAKSMQMLIRPLNYSTYANKKDWSRYVDRQSKSDQLKSIIFNVDENKILVKDMRSAGSAAGSAVQAKDENTN